MKTHFFTTIFFEVFLLVAFSYGLYRVSGWGKKNESEEDRAWRKRNGLIIRVICIGVILYALLSIFLKFKNQEKLEQEPETETEVSFLMD